jgi:hypothetical protein
MTANRMQITTHRRRPHPWPYEQERFSFCCSSSIYCTVTHAKGILTKQSADQMILPLCLYFIQTTRSRVHSPDGSRREKGQRERERERERVKQAGMDAPPLCVASTQSCKNNASFISMAMDGQFIHISDRHRRPIGSLQVCAAALHILITLTRRPAMQEQPSTYAHAFKPPRAIKFVNFSPCLQAP